MNERLKRDFKTFIDVELKALVKKHKKGGREKCTIDFYPDGNLEQNPLTFDSVKLLTKYLDSLGIIHNPNEVRKMKKGGRFYCANKKGSRTLIIRRFYYELESEVKGVKPRLTKFNHRAPLNNGIGHNHRMHAKWDW